VVPDRVRLFSAHPVLSRLPALFSLRYLALIRALLFLREPVSLLDEEQAPVLPVSPPEPELVPALELVQVSPPEQELVPVPEQAPVSPPELELVPVLDAEPAQE
jgi:hypothetical protein